MLRNRVAVQLQKNLDRVRLRRVAHKLSNPEPPAKEALAKPQNGSSSGSRTGGYFAPLPGQITSGRKKQKTPEKEEEDDDEYEYEDEEEQ